jgi:phage virion morphogenesis protein
MPAITITLDDARITQALQALLAAANHLEPVYAEIANHIKSDIELGFRDQQTPLSQDWLELSPVTLARRRKNGRGAEILRDTGVLNRSITYNALSHGFEIGSNLAYANMQNYGGKKADFPHLWGDIPARQFMPTAEETNQLYGDEIAQTVERHLQRAIT